MVIRFDSRRSLPSRRRFQPSRSIPPSPHVPLNRVRSPRTFGALLLSLGRKLFDRLNRETEKTPSQYLESDLRTLRAATRDDLAGILAAAMLAKKTLDTTRMVATPFPIAYFDGQAALDDEGRAQLRAYVQELKQFQKTCADSGMTLGQSVGKGLDIWIASLYALADPALFTKGRELWWLLIKGEQGVEAAYRFMVRRDLTEVEMAYLGYRPVVFSPITT